jgi:hypothetical protein
VVINAFHWPIWSIRSLTKDLRSFQYAHDSAHRFYLDMLDVWWFLYRHRASPYKHFLSSSPSYSTPFETHNYALDAKPCKGLKLAIRLTRVIDESRIVTLPPLPNLVRWMLPNLCLHHVKVLQASGGQTNEFSNYCSSRKVLPRISFTIVHLCSADLRSKQWSCRFAHPLCEGLIPDTKVERSLHRDRGSIGTDGPLAKGVVSFRTPCMCGPILGSPVSGRSDPMQTHLYASTNVLKRETRILLVVG